MNMPETDQTFVLSDGRRLGFAEYGDPAGQPVLHFHGSAGSRLDRPADESILWKQGIRFISVERPGQGLSGFQPKRRLVDWPKDVSELADHLELKAFYIEGWSAGGPHALACAWSLPERVKAVALIACGAPMKRKGSLTGLPFPNRVLAVSARWFPPLTYFIRWLTRRMILRDAQLASQRVMASIPEADKAALYAPKNLAVFVQSIQEGYRPGWRGVAQDDIIINRDWGFEPASIRVPVDIWHGEADVNVPIHAGHYLAATLPQARTYFLPGEGHFFVLQRWNEVLAALISPR
jgi:pimeloyl-ACP methyl ester carboxylesterase